MAQHHTAPPQGWLALSSWISHDIALDVPAALLWLPGSAPALCHTFRAGSGLGSGEQLIFSCTKTDSGWLCAAGYKLCSIGYCGHLRRQACFLVGSCAAQRSRLIS